MSKRRGRQDPFEGFQDVETIGHGAFAQVHRATDSYTGQAVALKVLTIEASRRLDTAVLDLEARALGTVNDHPNIVTLYRVVARPNQAPMLVMELCQGSLADQLERNGPLPVQQVIAIGVKLCGALQTAHDAGILHRDLKPQNLLITRYGEPALADFGVAALRDAAEQSASPLSGLTLLHAAPEVVLGHRASPASDVYGLVSALYELLGGNAPHFITEDEDPAVVQRRVLNDPPPALQAPGVSRRLSELVTQALSKAPDDRPPTARDLAQMLRLVERESGWPLTSCRIADGPDLPVPDTPSPPLPSTHSRAARVTGLPSLGLGAQPFDTDEPDAIDRGLEPLGPRETVLLPGRGSRWATNELTTTTDRTATSDPATTDDPTTRVRSAEPTAETPRGRADEPPAGDGVRLMRPPTGVLPGFGGDRTSADQPDPGPARATTPGAAQGGPPAPRVSSPSPLTPPSEADRGATPPPSEADRGATPPPPPSSPRATPPTAPPQPVASSSAAPAPSRPAPSAPTADPTAPVWGFEQRRGLQETADFTSSDPSQDAWPNRSADHPDEGKGRKRRRRRGGRSTA